MVSVRVLLVDVLLVHDPPAAAQVPAWEEAIEPVTE